MIETEAWPRSSDSTLGGKSLWQRGSNENTNGLRRQYLPRRLDFRTLTQADLDAIAKVPAASTDPRVQETITSNNRSVALTA